MLWNPNVKFCDCKIRTRCSKGKYVFEDMGHGTWDLRMPQCKVRAIWMVWVASGLRENMESFVQQDTSKPWTTPCPYCHSPLGEPLWPLFQPSTNVVDLGGTETVEYLLFVPGINEFKHPLSWSLPRYVPMYGTCKKSRRDVYSVGEFQGLES